MLPPKFSLKGKWLVETWKVYLSSVKITATGEGRLHCIVVSKEFRTETSISGATVVNTWTYSDEMQQSSEKPVQSAVLAKYFLPVCVAAVPGLCNWDKKRAAKSQLINISVSIMECFPVPFEMRLNFHLSQVFCLSRNTTSQQVLDWRRSHCHYVWLEIMGSVNWSISRQGQATNQDPKQKQIMCFSTVHSVLCRKAEHSQWETHFSPMYCAYWS